MRDFVSSLLCIPSNHGFWKNLCENCRKKKLMNFASKNNKKINSFYWEKTFAFSYWKGSITKG